MTSFITDTIICLLVAAGFSAVVAGCLDEPAFVDRCQNCGEYLEDAEAVHRHFAEGEPCR